MAPIHRTRVVGHWIVWLAWKRCKPRVMAFSVTRSQPNKTLKGNSVALPETAFSTTINKTPNDGISRGRMVSHPSNKVSDTCRIYAKVLWSSEFLLVVAQNPIKTLYVGVSFILAVTCIPLVGGVCVNHFLRWLQLIRSPICFMCMSKSKALY